MMDVFGYYEFWGEDYVVWFGYLLWCGAPSLFLETSLYLPLNASKSRFYQ